MSQNMVFKGEIVIFNSVYSTKQEVLNSVEDIEGDINETREDIFMLSGTRPKDMFSSEDGSYMYQLSEKLKELLFELVSLNKKQYQLQVLLDYLVENDLEKIPEDFKDI